MEPPLKKTLNCLNLGFRLRFQDIYAGWWAQGALLLLLTNALRVWESMVLL